MWNCKIYHDFNSMTLHDKNYKCLREIADDLGLTYQQVADLSSRKDKKKYQEFKYFPEIKITKIIKEVKRNEKNINNNNGEQFREFDAV